MMQQQLFLGQCWACSEPVSVEEVEQVMTDGTTIRLIWHHHANDCGAVGHTDITRAKYHELIKQWERIKKSLQSKGAQGARSYDPEIVGRLVQGFRIDLDAVETVADIELLWNDQARHDPWSIPTEL